MPRTLLVACEPQSAKEGIGLSPAVTASLDVAAAAVRDIVDGERAVPAGGRRRTPGGR